MWFRLVAFPTVSAKGKFLYELVTLTFSLTVGIVLLVLTVVWGNVYLNTGVIGSDFGALIGEAGVAVCYPLLGVYAFAILFFLVANTLFLMKISKAAKASGGGGSLSAAVRKCAKWMLLSTVFLILSYAGATLITLSIVELLPSDDPT